MKRCILILKIGIVCAISTMAFAAVPNQISLQGILWDGSGNPVADGSYSVLFRIYDAPAGGNILWSETQSVNTTGGVYTVLLGSTTPIPDTTFNGSSRWLGMKVGADPEMSPRQQLASTGYSFVSSQWTSAGQNLFRLNGNIGIGTATPTQKLEVAGTVHSTSGGFKFPDGTTQTTAAGGGSFVNLQGSTPGSQQTGHFNISGTGLFGGNVGIGATTPTQRLEVAGTIYSTSGGFKFPDGTTQTTAAGGGSFVNLQGSTPGSQQSGNMNISGTGLFGGNVGIGTTSPGTKLEINGNVRISGSNPLQLLGPAETIRFDAPTLGPAPGMLFTAHVTRQFVFGTYDGTTYSGTRMSIDGAGNVNITGTMSAAGCVCPSDARLKKNITPLTNVLEKLQNVQGVKFDWIEQTGKTTQSRQIGVIAQELKRVFPELVAKNANDYLSIDYGKFSAVLLEGIKEQQKEIGELKNKIEKLNNGLKTQVGEIEGLKAGLSELQNLVHSLSAKVRSTGDDKIANSGERMKK